MILGKCMTISSYHFILYICFVTTFLTLCNSENDLVKMSAEEVEEVPVDTVYSRGKEGWEYLERKSTKYSAEYSVTSEYVDTPLKKGYGVRVDNNHYSQSTGMVLSENVSRSLRSTIRAFNDKYAFSIVKNNDSDQYVIRWLEKKSSISNSGEIHDEYIEATVYPLCAWRFFGVPMNQWINQEGMTLDKVVKVKLDETNMYRIHFHYHPKSLERMHEKSDDAYVLVNPERHWRIHEINIGKMGAKGETRVSYRVEYDKDADDSMPVPSKAIYIVSNQDRSANYQRTIQFDSVQYGDVSEDKFYLSYYGLPEPNFEEPFLSAWMKYLLAGLVCLGIAYWIKRRRAAA